MNKLLGAALASVTFYASAGQAQTAAPLPIVAQQRAETANLANLPANTEVMLSMNEDLTTKGGKIDEGYKFGLSVAHDVMIGDYIVIPKGSPAAGEVTWRTGKGAFGKSGKMEIELRHIELNGRRIPISGKYRQEGEGNTVATVGTVVLVGVFAGFVTGKSARIPQGRELKAFTVEALPVALPAGAVIAPVAAPVQAVVPASQTESEPAPADVVTKVSTTPTAAVAAPK